MPTNLYEILSLAMRYVFTVLGLIIVLRAFSWLRKDRRITHQRRRQLRDAGTIGIFVVVFGSPDLPEGTLLPVPHEGVLGCLRSCDVTVPADGVAKHHLDLSFVDGKGLYVLPCRGCPCTVDGVELTTHTEARQLPMQHGSLLTIGEATLRLGVFDGLDVAQYLPPDPIQPPDSHPGIQQDGDFPYTTPYDEEVPR